MSSSLPQRQRRKRARRGGGGAGAGACGSRTAGVSAAGAAAAEAGSSAAAAAAAEGEEEDGGETSAAVAALVAASQPPCATTTLAAFVAPQRDESWWDPSWKFAYLDHTADVQLHAWGANLAEAFEQVVVAMMNYITPLHAVEVTGHREVRAAGHDMCSLLYNFMDECLYLFAGEGEFAARTVEVTHLDEAACTIAARLGGERFDLAKHPQGTEVKAITYSNMQVHDVQPPERDYAEIFVVIDI